ncbi:hypothetical protein [Kitasatospora sp. GP82]|uniref:hypothetical protein n=1 Tax=Kitasatospora sp. GP82 TaxID=3035089 RepID=UPI002476716D|nr:hypothetical protein [Kitasatospora sp. GP82]MDH6129956.1 hypothetical protein [Kitasatospora sp. GP82]
MSMHQPSADEIVSRLPELAPYGRSAVRLHPERGEPTEQGSSVGGPLLWPSDEPWPMCSEPDDEEPSGLPAVAMVPVAQIYASDAPGPWWPTGIDLLQILWCPNEHWEAPPNQADVSPLVEVRWRRAADVGVALPPPPVPARHYDYGYLPNPCTIRTEQIIDFPYREELPEELRPRLRKLIEDTDIEGKDSITRIAGWKIGGWPTWHLTCPSAFDCEECQGRMALLFTVASDDLVTGVVVGRAGDLRIFACPNDHRHPFHVDLH